MPSLESRVVELESKATSSQTPMKFLLILCGFGDEVVPLTSLTCRRSGRVFNRLPDETEDAFKTRVKDELCTGESPLVMVHRNH